MQTYIQRNIKLSYTGKLLFVEKNITGVITPTNSTAVNIPVKNGYYLVVDSFIDKKSENVFFEILVENKIILVRIKNSRIVEFLY